MTALEIDRPSLAAPVLAKLRGLRDLNLREETRIRALENGPRLVAAGATLLSEGEPTSRPVYVASGWAARQRVLQDGRRQIFSLILPGDGLGLCRRPRPLAFATTLALTRMTLLDAAPLLDGASVAHCELTPLFDRAAALDEELMLNHMVRLGRLTAYERTASLLIELDERLRLVGLSDGATLPFPLTQEVLADVLGISPVHVSRTLQQMRRDRVAEVSHGQARLLDREQLARVGTHEPLQMIDPAPGA